MAQEAETIESIRARYETQIMAVEGVVGVSSGLDKGGTPCLMIYTSVPPEEVRGKLPESIFRVCVQIDNVGEIKAQ